MSATERDVTVERTVTVANKNGLHARPSSVLAEGALRFPQTSIAIRKGELNAIDVSTKRGGRPRYRIDEADIEVFEARRAASLRLVTDQPRRCRRKRDEPHIIKFF